MPRTTVQRSGAALLFALLPMLAPAAAHEFWIEPKQFSLAPGAPILADLKVGQNFSGEVHPYLKSRFTSFRVSDATGSRDIKGDEGDTPAANVRAVSKGLSVITYLATAHRLDYEKWADFVDYLRYEGLDWVVDAHRKRALPETGFAEAYIRCAKALVQVGEPSAPDADRPTGMPLELVAGKNPYKEAGDQLPVTLLWQGKPIGDIQIRTFQDNGVVSESTTRTDANGTAVVSLAGGGKFLLNAVHMRESSANGVQWESHWASLTFEIRR